MTERHRASPGRGRNASLPKPEKAATVPSPPRSRWTIWLVLALIAINVAAYYPVLGHGFVDYDDKQYVVENPHVAGGLTSANISWALTSEYAANWHPLTWLSHMMDVSIFGMRPGAQHVINVVLHIGSTVLLFMLLHSTTGSVGRSAFVAGLFAVHPVHVESVAWIAERKDVLSAVLWMATLCAYVAYVRKSDWSRYAALLFFYAAGLMAKPMLVTLPLVLLLLDFWPLRRLPGLYLILEKVPLFALAAVSSVVTFVVQRQGGAMTRLDFIPFGLRINNALWSYLAYIGKMIWPTRLAVFYPLPHEVSFLHALVAVLVLAGATFAAIRNAGDHPYLAVGWFWYLVTLVPVIGIVQVGVQSMADRYTYLPLIGLFLAITWGVADLVERWPVAKRALPVAAGIAIVGCAAMANAQVRHWENSTTLWTHTLNVTTDNYFADASLGYVLWTQGKLDEAIQHYRVALRIRSDFAEAHNNLGVALAGQGKLQEAIAEFSEAIRINPAWSDAQRNLDATRARQQHSAGADERLARFYDAVRTNPNDVSAHNSLGAALAEENRVDDAIREFSEALRILPNNPDLHYNLAAMLQRKSRVEEAREHLRTALKINPHHEDAKRLLDDLMKQ